MCGRDHESTHAAAKQAIYDILVRDLSLIMPFDKTVKQAFSALVEEFYNPKSVVHDAFKFAPKIYPESHFTFPAVTKFIMGQPDIHKIVLCYVPAALTERIWDLTDHLLADGVDDDFVAKHLPFFSPSIRKAHSVYDALPTVSPFKQSKFSASCFMDQFGHWRSSVTLFPAMGNSMSGSDDQNGKGGCTALVLWCTRNVDAITNFDQQFVL